MSADPPVAPPSPAAGPPGSGPSSPGNAVTSPTPKKSGGGCTKGCLGCGCITLIGLIIVLLGGGIFLWSQGPQLREGLTESVALFSDSGSGPMSPLALAGGAGTGSAGSGATPSLDQLPASSSEGQNAQRGQVESADRFFAMLDAPMTQREMRAVNASMKEWDESRTVRRLYGLLDEAEALQDSDSLMDNMRKARVIFSLGFRLRDISEEYPAHVDKHGGEDYVARQTRMLAVHRVSQIGAGNRHEPWEQAVAEAIIKDHDENRADFEKARALIRQAAQDDSFDLNALSEREQAELYEAFSNQFLLLSSAVNRDTLVAWSRLSDDERKEISERFNAPHNYLSRTFGLFRMEGSQDLLFLHFMGL